MAKERLLEGNVIEGDVKAKKRLWIVTELYYPEMTSTGYYLTKLAESLSGDMDVKVICGQPNYSARGVIAPKREVREDVEIFRAAGTTFDKNVIVYRIINMLTLGLSVLFLALAKFRKGDEVMVVTTPPTMPFITALASLVRGASHVLLIHDNYPEILVAVNKAKENSLFVRTLGFFNRWLYKYAAKIIVVGRDMKELVAKKTEGLDIPIVTIPNWAELETVCPAPRDENALLEEIGIMDKLVFLYAGNMGHPNDLESIVWCAEKLIDREEFHFIFLGAGVKKGWLLKEKSSKLLGNITVLDPKPRSEQPVFLNACDVALVSLVDKMWGVSMPSRTYNILAAGKPILALTEHGSEIAQVISDDNVGWSVPPQQPERLLRLIEDIYARKDELREMGKRARQAALEKYSLAVAVKGYYEALK